MNSILNLEGLSISLPHNHRRNLNIRYLLDDTQKIYHLLQVGIGRWRQLKSALDRDPNLLSAEERTRVLSLIKVFETVQELYNRGRGRSADREALERSGSVSGSFIEKLSEFLKENNGDAKKLIQALESGEIPRFRRDSLDSLRDFLSSEGYLVEDEPLTKNDIRNETLLRFREQLASSGLSIDLIDQVLHTSLSA